MVVLATDNFLLIFVWKLLQETFKMRIFKSMVVVWKIGDLLAFFHQKICQDIFLTTGFETRWFSPNFSIKITAKNWRWSFNNFFWKKNPFFPQNCSTKLLKWERFFWEHGIFVVSANFWNCSVISKVGVFEEYGVQNSDFPLIFRLFFCETFLFFFFFQTIIIEKGCFPRDF